VLIGWAWLMAGWAAYLARVAGRLGFVPQAWWPSPEVHLIFIGVAKLMLTGLFMTWIRLILYRRLRWPSCPKTHLTSRMLVQPLSWHPRHSLIPILREAAQDGRGC
jgi:hypothetical protein